MPAQKWYPNLPGTTESTLREAIRRILDSLYQLRDTLGPTMLEAIGTETVTIETAANAIDGLNLTFQRAGTWLVTAIVELDVDDAGETFTLALVQNGVEKATLSLLKVNSAPSIHMQPGAWTLVAMPGDR